MIRQSKYYLLIIDNTSSRSYLGLAKCPVCCRCAARLTIQDAVFPSKLVDQEGGGEAGAVKTAETGWSARSLIPRFRMQDASTWSQT